ncbi:hypothetical protein SAMN04487910_2065 [Aquimarina amphilecti]|uniref:Lipoprotein n=1 Tax=Aquimarina amphilecti TaxID=1038014 RepID=A0A1H7NF55_AQUAM|nr:hypothetical protein [Aquimarina amphilecti]SEL22192.1 hypothetical protein SAMN04487910_2065 [Aquimarina amphilecti]
MKLQTNPIKKYLMIVFACLSVISCKDTVQTNSAELEKFTNTIKQKDSIINELQKQLGNITNDKRTPENIIQSDFAKKIYHLYNDREDLINKVVGKDGIGEPFKATRSLFYDIDELQKYIRYVKIKSRRAGEKPSGFRFYFALYPEDYIRNKTNKRYAKRQTFFIAPTKAVKDVAGNIEHVGYTLDNNFKVELLTEKIGLDSRMDKDGNIQKGSFFSFNTAIEDEENSLIANELTGSPPKGKQ